VALVIDVFARRIVGWRVSTSMATQFVLDTLEQAIWQRKYNDNNALIHHSDRGSQYLSIKYTERLIEVGIDPSVGTVGEPYDNALAECVIGLFKTEVINQIGPWKSMREVEWETLKRVDWYHNRRLLGSIGYIPPTQAEETFYSNLNKLDMVTSSLNKPPSGILGTIHRASPSRTSHRTDRAMKSADRAGSM
jgi:transposase InsO family protein